MIILFAVLILFMGILFLPLRVSIKYNNKLSYSLSLGGIPVPMPEGNKKKHRKQKEKESEADKKEDSHEDFSDKLEKSAGRISKYIDILKAALHLTKKYIHMDKLTVQISSGTGEAASTAVSIGILWGSVYSVIGLIGQIITMEAPVININPDYEKASFKAYAKCIISTRIVYIIFIGIIILFKSVRKDKEV